MSDRRHQRGFPRAEHNRSSAAFYERVYGKWEFFKKDLQTGKIESVKVAKVGLEITTAICNQGIIENVRMSKTRYSFFTQNNLKDVDWFCAVGELKRGAKIWTPKAIYWATFTPPTYKPKQQLLEDWLEFDAETVESIKNHQAEIKQQPAIA